MKKQTAEDGRKGKNNDSFGFMTNSTGSATNWFRYAGRHFDSSTALYYNRARYYDPTTGRFVSEDPIRFSGGANFYQHARNSPIDLSDPSGLCPSNPCAPMGDAPGPSQYQAMGRVARSSRLFGFDVVVPANAGAVSLFKRGWPLDAQVLYGGSQAYANYAFGVFMSAAGFSLSDALAGANAYGANFSKYPLGTQMDPTYTKIPASNVQNIIQGFNDQQNGTLCATH